MSLYMFLMFSLCIILLGLYFHIRNEWICYRRCKHIDRHLDEFHKVKAKFSYGDMLYKYFYVWDYNWFIEKALERK